MARKQCKGRNGVGLTVTVTFDHHDPYERKAQEMAQILARKHGRRKDAIVALLAAMYDYYTETGEMMSPGTIASAFNGGHYSRMGFTSAGNRQVTGQGDNSVGASLVGNVPNMAAIMELPSGRTFDDSNEPLIQVVDAQPQRASAAEVAYNHAIEMGNLFDD